jgi:hypothetical protein
MNVVRVLVTAQRRFILLKSILKYRKSVVGRFVSPK